MSKGKGYVIGSAAGCDVVIHGDEYVSPRHAHVWEHDGTVWVEDLGSTNGTHIIRDRGGRKVSERVHGPTEVGPFDEVRIGRTTIPARRKP